MDAPQIRPLDPDADLAQVIQFYAEAPDYWEMAEGKMPGQAKAREFFTDGPPDCDPAVSHRLGMFLGSRLSGLAELSFGFPDKGDAYLGFLMLGPWARNNGHGALFLQDVERRARQSGSPSLYLAVMETNPRGLAFWEREGFVATGLSGTMMVGTKQQTLHRLIKSL